MERITANGHRVVTYNPRRYSKRTLFNRVIKELKIVLKELNNVKELKTLDINIRNFRLLVLSEFKERFKPDFIHTGNIYEYRYVKTIHSRFVRHCFNDYKYFYRGCNSEFFIDIDNKYRNELVEDYMKSIPYKLRKEIVDYNPIVWKKPKGCVEWNRISNDKMEETYIDKDVSCSYWKGLDGKSLGNFVELLVMNGCIEKFGDFKNKTFGIKPNGFHTIKLRFKVGRMDLLQNNNPFYSPLNLKYWDKDGKTSNKGLKAIYPYNWEKDYSHQSGWSFGGIKVDDLHYICKINKMPNYNRKMKYGELALWWYKGLM